MDNICKWAHERISTQDFVLLDTETTDLDGEIIDLTILDAAGATIFDSLIKPIGRISEGARAVHHISDAMLANAPTFAQIWPLIWTKISGQAVITYNTEFDFKIMVLSLIASGIKDESYNAFTASEERWHCLMDGYRQHIQHRRWQKLDAALQQQRLPVSNTHKALADAQAAYSLLKHLASKYPGSAYEARQKAQTTQISQVADARGRDNASE